MLSRRFGSFRGFSGRSVSGGSVSSQLILGRLIFKGGAFLTLLLSFCAGAEAQWNPLNPVTNVEPQDDGVRFA